MIRTIAGAVALTFAAAQPATAAVTFTNTTPISIPDADSENDIWGHTSSTINVSGLSGTITGLTVSLNGLTHSYPGDLAFILLGPGGQALALMSGVGGGYGVDNISITFDGTSTNYLTHSVSATGPIVSGTYDIANYGEFGGGVDAEEYYSWLSHYNGGAPNGAWELHAFDLAQQDTGSVNGGWSISFDVAAASPVPEPGTWAMLILGFGAAGAGMRFRRGQALRTAIA